MRRLILFIMLSIICGYGEVSAAPPTLTVDNASKAFKTGIKARMSNNYEVSRALISQIEIGMTSNRVAELFGPPDSRKTAEDETYWSYTLFYSQFIDVTFDPEGNVTKILSTLDNSGLDEAEQAGAGYPPQGVGSPDP